MRWAESKLQARARILEAGLNAAQARNCPSADSTRTVSPGSPPPLAMADSKIQGWWRCRERSLPARSRMVFMGLDCAPRHLGWPAAVESVAHIALGIWQQRC